MPEECTRSYTLHVTHNYPRNAVLNVVGVSAVMTVAKLLLDLILPHTSPCRWNPLHPRMLSFASAFSEQQSAS
jgi:hypothetical protein